ncbi:MAG: biopolymer transporter ExbD [Bdellovibrionales bacterium]|nr:biopolymer transporter ExbD [Bdellovibrionales bacterium]
MTMRLGGEKSGGDEGEADIVAEINITPLTDIFLVLLIIFMVTSSVLTSNGVDVNLPQASPQTAQAQPEGVVVSLLPRGKMAVNGQPIEEGDYDRLTSAVKNAFTQTSSRLVILEGDREAFLGSAIEVMDATRKAGAEKFAIATAPTKN